jgi:predicted RNA-binding Zn-ribbon protein involved in translation (DUF1610 family)
VSRPPTLEYQSNQPQTPPKPRCRNCGAQMLQGVATHAYAGESARSSRLLWLAGEIRRGWLGIFLMPKGRPYEMVAFRCPGCGLVEFYSPVTEAD